MTVVYLAGPMSGYPLWNFPAFDEAAALLRSRGYGVVSPAEVERAQGFDPATPPSGFTLDDRHRAMRRDLQFVTGGLIEGVALLDGWELSEGARLESQVALAIGLTVSTVGLFVSLADLQRSYA